MSITTIERPAPAAAPLTVAEVRERVAAARRARRQRHINDAANALRKVGNVHKVADALGLPLCFVIQVGVWLGITVEDPEDTITWRSTVSRWETTVEQPARVLGQTRAQLAAAGVTL